MCNLMRNVQSENTASSQFWDAWDGPQFLWVYAGWRMSAFLALAHICRYQIIQKAKPLHALTYAVLLRSTEGGVWWRMSDLALRLKRFCWYFLLQDSIMKRIRHQVASHDS